MSSVKGRCEVGHPYKGEGPCPTCEEQQIKIDAYLDGRPRPEGVDAQCFTCGKSLWFGTDNAGHMVEHCDNNCAITTDPAWPPPALRNH